MLLLKEYNVYYQSGKTLEPCYMVVTVDKFLHCFLSPKGVLCKPTLTFRIDGSLLVKSEGETKVELRRKDERKRSVMSYIRWDAKAEAAHVIQFTKKDTKEEFCMFIKSLC